MNPYQAIRKLTRAALVLTTMLASLAWATKPGSAPLVLGINEGATTSRSMALLMEQYEPLARLVSSLAGEKVVIEPFIDAQLFRQRFDSGSLDIVFGKSINILADGVLGGKYTPLVKTSEPYVAGLIASPTAGITQLTDLLNRDVLLPPEDVFTSQLAMAAFRDAGLAVVKKDPRDRYPTSEKGVVTVRHIRYQEAVASTVAVGWYPAGVVNPTVLSKWVKDKGAVVTKLKPQPGWAILGNTKLSPRLLESIQAALLEQTRTDEAHPILKALKVPRLVPATADEYRRVAEYIRVPATVAATSIAARSEVR